MRNTYYVRVSVSFVNDVNELSTTLNCMMSIIDIVIYAAFYINLYLVNNGCTSVRELK